MASVAEEIDRLVKQMEEEIAATTEEAKRTEMSMACARMFEARQWWEESRRHNPAPQ